MLSSDTMALYVREADELEWPREMGRRWQEFAADGSLLPLPAASDFAIVQVSGTAVGVQVDTSGAVAVGWSVHRQVRGADRRWDVELHRSSPREWCATFAA